MSDLSTLVESLKRTVAVPGAFDAAFPDPLDTDIAALLADAYAEAQLDGFFPTGQLTTTTVSPDLVPAEGALVVIYAAARMVAAKLLNAKNRTKYQAGSASADLEQSAKVLSDLLALWNKRKEDLRERAATTSVGSALVVADQYLARAIGSNEMAYMDSSFVLGFDDPFASGW